MTQISIHSSPCIICGRARIAQSSETEDVGTSSVTVTQMVCPDPECQAKVDKQLSREREKREMLQKNKDDRTSSWGKRKKQD